MPGTLIVIAGSADPQRADYDTTVDAAGAQAAAEQLGIELARAGCRIMVYSSAPTFIEAYVVRGFVNAKPTTPKVIQVRFPASSAAANFPEYELHPDLFEFQADPHPEWEASFYRSLREAEGVVLIGGGRSVLITGHLALGYRIPLLALAAFGGAAKRVWQAIVPGQDLPLKDDRNLMARPWSPAAAAACIGSLLDQHERRLAELVAERKREQDQARDARNRSWMVGLLVLLTLAVLATGLGWSSIGHLWFQVLLLFSGALAGAAGSTVRTLWVKKPDQTIAQTLALGLAAGAISSVLYIAAQIAANPALLRTGATFASELPRPLLLFAVVIGFIAGLTFDAVFRKLVETDVVHTEAVAVKKP
jgi:hypothetical protein